MSEVMKHVSHTLQGVSCSETAKKHLLNYLEKSPVYKGVRLSVKKTGCSGLSYVVDYVEAPQAADIAVPLERDYQIYIDKAAYPFLKGLHMDYVREGLNYKFVFQNPNQTGQCGCGESFSVDSQFSG